MGKRIRWAARNGDDAVSPVVGSILILVIMILAVGGIVAFGVPIINGLQDYAEFQNVVTQFQELDGDVRNLRDPQNVRISSLSINKGEIDLSRGDRWVITVITHGELKTFTVRDWEQADDASDNYFEVESDATADTTFYLHEVRGSTFIQMDTCTSAASPANRCDYTGTLVESDTVFRLQARRGTAVWGEAWIMNMGRLSFFQSATSELNKVHYQMGAVMTQQAEAFFIQQVPTIKEPDAALGDNSLFIRALRLQVDQPGDVSGQGRHTFITNLIDNYGAARGRPAYDDIKLVRIQIDGDMEEAFCRYFSDRAGWTIINDCDTPGPYDYTEAEYIDNTVTGIRFDLIHSEVDADLRTI